MYLLCSGRTTVDLWIGVKDVAADDEGVATAGDEAPAGPAQPMVMPEASTAGAPTYKVLG